MTTVANPNILSNQTLTIPVAKAICMRIEGSQKFFARSIAGRIHPTDSQKHWILKLAREQLARESGQEVEKQILPQQTGEQIDVKNIVEMFAKAKTHIQKPKIRLRASNNKEIILSLAPDNGNNPGAIYVRVADEYAGKITKEGFWVPKDRVWDMYKERIVQFSANPTEEAVRYGQLVGQCCFCGRTLTNPESILRSIGPICLGHWGL